VIAAVFFNSFSSRGTFETWWNLKFKIPGSANLRIFTESRLENTGLLNYLSPRPKLINYLVRRNPIQDVVIIVHEMKEKD